MSWSHFLTGIAGVAVGALLVSHRDDEVSAKRFFVLSDSGEKVGEFASETGGAHLSFKNSDGETTLKVTSVGDKAYLETFVKGNANVRVGQDGADSWLQILGGASHSGASLWASGDTAMMNLTGGDHQSLSLSSGDPLAVSMIVRDPDGKERYILSAGGKGKPVLMLKDRDDKEFDAFALLKPPAEDTKK